MSPIAENVTSRFAIQFGFLVDLAQSICTTHLMCAHLNLLPIGDNSTTLTEFRSTHDILLSGRVCLFLIKEIFLTITLNQQDTQTRASRMSGYYLILLLGVA